MQSSALVFACLLLARPSGSGAARVPAGFAVSVRSVARISAETVAPGDSLTFEVSGDHIYEGCRVFVHGAGVVVVVRTATQRGPLGQPSTLELEVVRTTASDGQAVFLNGTISVQGEDREMEAIGSAASFCCLGVFLPGETRDLGAGAGTLAFTRAAVVVNCH